MGKNAPTIKGLDSRVGDLEAPYQGQGTLTVGDNSLDGMTVSQYFNWKREGSFLHLFGTLAVIGTGTSNNFVRLFLPDGLNVTDQVGRQGGNFTNVSPGTERTYDALEIFGVFGAPQIEFGSPFYGFATPLRGIHMGSNDADDTRSFSINVLLPIAEWQ